MTKTSILALLTITIVAQGPEANAAKFFGAKKALRSVRGMPAAIKNDFTINKQINVLLNHKTHGKRYRQLYKQAAKMGRGRTVGGGILTGMYAAVIGSPLVTSQGEPLLKVVLGVAAAGAALVSGKLVVQGIQQGRVAGRVAVIEQALLDAGKRSNGDISTLLESNAGLVDYYTQNVPPPSLASVKQLRRKAASLNQANKNRAKAGNIADTIKAKVR